MLSHSQFPPPGEQGRVSKTLDYGSRGFADALGRVLSPEALHPLRVQNGGPIDASSVLPKAAAEHLRAYSERYRTLVAEGKLEQNVHAIHEAAVEPGFVPEHLSHQDQPGFGVDAQARMIARAGFLEAIANHPETVPLHGYESTRRYLLDVAALLRALSAADELFRSPKVKALIDTRAESELVAACFGVVWPPGVDLYRVLGELYPAFHARMTIQIPLALAERLDQVFEQPLDRALVRGLPRSMIDGEGRYLGVYPMTALEREGVTSTAPFVSQDQIGRRAIVKRVFDDAAEILARNPKQVVVVVDYAGGVGNLSELLLRHVHALPDSEQKRLLVERMRVVVVDTSATQLTAGRSRAAAMATEPGLAGIERQLFFFQHDMRQRLDQGLSRIFRPSGDPAFPLRPVYLGMTSYTLGALDGVRSVIAVADEMHALCHRVYAVDFSSPIWRMEDFLRDTGMSGRQYLRLVHGLADPGDFTQGLPALIRPLLRRRFQFPIRTVAEYVKHVSLGAGLASHYVTVWPHAYGHCAGYSVRSDGSLERPAVLAFAERLAELGANVRYKSKVLLYFGIDVGSCRDGKRAWFLSPGFVADFVVSENPARGLSG